MQNAFLFAAQRGQVVKLASCMGLGAAALGCGVGEHWAGMRLCSAALPPAPAPPSPAGSLEMGRQHSLGGGGGELLLPAPPRGLAV